jgi:hypothetical protein
MNKLILFIASFAILIQASSKDVVGIYRSYEDYLYNNLDTMDLYLGYSHPKNAVTLQFVKFSEEYKVRCKEIWGFRLGARLFRVDVKTGQPACVISTGNIVYYENGPSYMEGFKSKKASIEFTFGYFSYFSKDLESEMTPYDQKSPEAGDRYSAFKKENPRYEFLFKCIGKSEDYVKIRNCVRNYNAEKDEE